MRKKGDLKVSGADGGWWSITDYEDLYLQLVRHDKGLSHSQVTVVDTQEVTMESDDQRAGKQCSVVESEVTVISKYFN